MKYKQAILFFLILTLTNQCQAEDFCNDEIKSINHDLKELLRFKLLSPYKPYLDEILKRLTQFEAKFNTPIRNCSNFCLLKSTAINQLQQIRNTHPSTIFTFDTSFQAGLLLHELAGEHTKTEILIKKPYVGNHGEWHCNKYKLIYQAMMNIRLGRYKKALKLVESVMNYRGHESAPIKDSELLFYHGYLLIKTTQIKNGKNALYAVTDLFPKTNEASLAKRVLHQFGGYNKPTGLRVSSYLAGKHWRLALSSLVHHKLDDAYFIITKYCRQSTDIKRAAAILQLGKLNDIRAVPLLEHFLSTGSNLVKANSSEALCDLGELQYLPHYIQLVYCPNDFFHDNAAKCIQKRLTDKFPCGPKVTKIERFNIPKVKQVWQHWARTIINKGKPRAIGWLIEHQTRTPYCRPKVTFDSIRHISCCEICLQQHDKNADCFSFTKE